MSGIGTHNVNVTGGTITVTIDEIVTNNTVLANAVASAVVGSTETTIASYTAVTNPAYITGIVCSGQEYGKFRVFIDSNSKIVLRGGSDRNTQFKFETPLRIEAGETISLKVTHFVTGETPDFECSILGYQA